jgi:guanine deaminase
MSDTFRIESLEAQIRTLKRMLPRVLVVAGWMLAMPAVAQAEKIGIRGTFFDFVANPWELTAQGEDEADSARYVTDGLLVIEDGMIVDFGEYKKLGASYPELDITRYENRVIMPGMIDGHIHFPQTRIVGAYGKHLLEWLQEYVFPEESLYFDSEYASVGAKKFMDNILSSGTTTVQAFTTTRPETTIALFEEAQNRDMRIIAGVTGIDRNAPDYYRDTPQSFYENSKQLIERYHGKGRLLYAITPRFAFGSSKEQLAMCGKLKKEYPDCWVNTHLAETIPECRAVAEYFPESKNYLDVYDSYGLVGPKFSGGHSIQLSEREFQRLHDSGACVVFCPCSNLWLGSGLFQIGSATDPSRPVPIAIGTDMGAGNTFSLFRVLNNAYKVGMLNNVIYSGTYSPTQNDPQRAERNKISPYRAYYMATLGGARALKLDEWIGSFEKGKEADFIVVDLDGGPREQSWIVSRYNLGESAKPGTIPTDAETLGKRSPTNKEQCVFGLFAVMGVGDSRAIDETWVYGKKRFDRQEFEKGERDPGRD